MSHHNPCWRARWLPRRRNLYVPRNGRRATLQNARTTPAEAERGRLLMLNPMIGQGRSELQTFMQAMIAAGAKPQQLEILNASVSGEHWDAIQEI